MRKPVKKTNRDLFEELPVEKYFKSVEAAAKFFREITRYPDSLGFDQNSGGYLAMHRGHAPSGFEFEIPVCVFLKKAGFGVVLLEELPHTRSVDAKIDGVLFEIKQIGHARNFTRAVLHQFRNAYVKCDHILLHIAQTVEGDQVRNALLAGAKAYPSIKLFWIVFRGRLFQMERRGILKKEFRIP